MIQQGCGGNRKTHNAGTTILPFRRGMAEDTSPVLGGAIGGDDDARRPAQPNLSTGEQHLALVEVGQACENRHQKQSYTEP